MNNGLCKYFDNKNSLDAHYKKNPSHRSINYHMCMEEASRRVKLRSGSYSNKVDRDRKEQAVKKDSWRKGVYLQFTTVMESKK